MLDDTLYIIVPYFNFVNYNAGQRNLDNFLANLSLKTGIKIVLVEGYQEQHLPDYSDKVFKHIKVHVPDVLWVKENLINIGFNHLPEHWQYGGWFDRDVLLLSPSWVEETKAVLQTVDIAQPWTQCIYLNSFFEYAPLMVRDKTYPVAESLTGLHS